MTPAPEAQPGRPLARFEGAVRDTKPAWMTKGLGIGDEMLGKATGELMKPGLTKADLERIKNSTMTGPDPFGDFFAERKGNDGPAPARAPLPDQGALFGSTGGETQTPMKRAPLPSQDEIALGKPAPTSAQTASPAPTPGLPAPGPTPSTMGMPPMPGYGAPGVPPMNFSMPALGMPPMNFPMPALGMPAYPGAPPPQGLPPMHGMPGMPPPSY